MPRGDGTGPRGMGPMTGRAAGFCSGSANPGYFNPLSGGRLGLGMRRGWTQFSAGRGWCRWNYGPMNPGGVGYGFYASPGQGSSPAVEKQALKNQAEFLKSELELIKKRLEDIESETNHE